MVFSNAVFLFAFLPIVLAIYYILPTKAKNYWLLLASLVFYAWNKPEFLFILIFSIFINYLFALFIEKCSKNNMKKFFLVAGILGNLLLLFYFKYFNFTIEIVNQIMDSSIDFSEVVLPIGISFFTFQGLSYVVDVYRGDTPAQKNLLMLGMYISMFPQLVAGPIVRYKDINSEINIRKVEVSDFAYGIERFIIGLSKKVLLADTLAVVVDEIFRMDPTYHSISVAWLGVIAYSLQIYFDFSGYSDMAIGLGRMFGFHFLENFNYPYISKSITEFWRRWHISLSSFFRDYVYIPLGGNRKHAITNVAIVFLLTGIWHGAAYTYIVWGIWHGIFNILEKFSKRRGTQKVEDSVWIGFVKHVYTLLVVAIGWVFFRAPNMLYAWQYIGAMFGATVGKISAYTTEWFLDRWTSCVLVLAMLFATPLLMKIVTVFKEKVSDFVWKILKYLVLLLCLMLCVLNVASNTYSAFIYFQF